jgi:hypothetical protein
MKKLRVGGAAVTAFFLSLALFVGMSAYIEYGRRARENEQMMFIASTVIAQAYEVLSAQLKQGENPGGLIVQNNGGTEGFERVARLLVTDESVRNVLLAPNGIVTDVYPARRK